MPLSESAIQIFSSVKAWIEPALESVGKRLDDFDVRLKAIPAGAKGEPGINGKDAYPAFVQQLEAVSNVERIPGPQGELGPIGLQGPIGISGKDGIPGHDADPVLVTQLIEKHVALAVSVIPAAPSGRDGINGKDADLDEMERMVRLAVAEIPKPKDGTDGINGKDGGDGLNGKDGQHGRDADPALISAEVEKQFATMAAEFAEGLNGD